MIGYVEYAHAIHGSLYVKVMNGWELDELHNVYIDTPINGQNLTYNSVNGLWENSNPLNDLQSRRTGFTLFDDMWASSTGQSPFVKGVIGAGTIALGNGSGSNHGVINISSNTTSINSGGYILFVNTPSTRAINVVDGIGYNIIFRPTNLSSTVYYYAGLTQGRNTTQSITDGAYFDIQNTTLVGKTTNNSVSSSTSSYTITNNAWYHLRVRFNLSKVDFYIYDMGGTLLWSSSLTTNIPTSGDWVQPSFFAQNTIQESRAIATVDYMSVTYPQMNRGALTE